MKLTWQTDSLLRVTALSRQMRGILNIDALETPVTLSRIVGSDGPHDFGIIAHEWAVLGERVQFEMTCDGVRYFMEVEPLYGPAGDIVGVDGVMRIAHDVIAAQRRASIVAHGETLIGSGSWYYDARTGEYEWSDGMHELLGVDAWMPYTRNIRAYDAPEDAKMTSLAMEHARLGHASYTLEHRIVRVDGNVRHVSEKASFFFDDLGQLTHVVGTLLDITDRKIGQARLEHLAYHDPLSDLPNRAFLEERFVRAIERARFQGTLCGLLFMDIDGFKAINDAYGHACGDDLLRAIGARLRTNVRSGDTLARFGGDEFVILLDSLDDEAAALKIANSALEIFNDPFTIGGHRLQVTASIGIAIAPPDGSTLEAALDASDTTMYRAKRDGGNRAYTALKPQVAADLAG